MTEKKIRLVPGTEFVFKQLSIKRSIVNKLPRKTALCDDKLSNMELKLSQCLEENLQKDLGCRLPWSNDTSSDRAPCSEDHYPKYKELLSEMYYWSDKNIYEFGCRPSCQIVNYDTEEDLVALKTCDGSPYCRM